MNENGEPDPDGSLICGVKAQFLNDFERAIAIANAVTRWRTAHPDLALTDQECVVATFAKIRHILPPNMKSIFKVDSTILLMLEKL